MASIPVLSRPTVRQTPEQSRLAVNPAQQVGVALQQASGAVNEFARELNRLNEIRVNEALDKYAGEADGLQQELLTKQGTKAAEGLDPFRDKLTIARGNIEAELGNDDQRALFALRSERYSRDADRRAFGHVQAETRRTDIQRTTSLRTRLTERVALEARQGADPTETIRELDHLVAEFGDRQGWGTATIDGERFQAVSTARAAQLTAMANTEDEEVIAKAREIFAAEQGAMTERDRQSVKDDLQSGDLLARAQKATDETLATHPNDEVAALASVREKYTGQLRDQVESRVKARFAEREQQSNRADTTTLETVMQKVERTGDMSSLTSSELSVIQRRGWVDNVQTRATQVRNGQPPVSEISALEEIWKATREGTLKDIVPLTYRSRLNDRDYRVLNESVDAAKTGGNGRQNPAVTQEQIARYTFTAAQRLRLVDEGIADISALKGEQEVKFNALRAAVAFEVDRQEELLKRNLLPSELEAAARSALYFTVMTEPKWTKGPLIDTPLGDMRFSVMRSGNVTRADRAARAEELVRSGWSESAAQAQAMRDIP